MAIAITTALFFGGKWLLNYSQINACIEEGGSWNYELKECEKSIPIKEIETSDLYWKADYDTVNNREFLTKGIWMDSIKQSPEALIETLNQRDQPPKIEFINLQSDTISVRIINDKDLTEQMGSAGSHCYLGETVFTLTENKSIKFVNIVMKVGSHANPVVYSREDFMDLVF